MRSSGASDGGRHSVDWDTRRSVVRSGASGFFAPTHSVQKPMYWTPDGPGHWPEGSAEFAVKGLPMTPMFVVLIQTLPAVETQVPGPLMSGTASIDSGCLESHASAWAGSSDGSSPGAGAPRTGGTAISSSTRAGNKMR